MSGLKETCFERAIFFSWYCSTADCKFCYMSTQPKGQKMAVRSFASILAEFILCKKLGWDIGFLSGGHNAYTTTDFLEMLKLIKKTINEKIWINIGPIKKQELMKFKPYIKGVVASIETINPKVHDLVCPSKQIKPFEKMLNNALKLKLKTAMTIILGLGETIDDFKKLKVFIKKYKISKIHFYGLNPQKGTVFEKAKPPKKEYMAEWIRMTRKEFPKIGIQAGIWLDRVDYVSDLLKAGANSISKFPAIRHFGSKYAKEIEKQAETAGRKFKGTLTEFKRFDVDKEIKKLKINETLKEKVKNKLELYLRNITPTS